MTNSDELWRQILAILAVFGLLALAIRRLKQPNSGGEKAGAVGTTNWLSQVLPWTQGKGGVRTRTRRLKKLESLALTAHHSVHVVSLDGQDVLVATGPQGCAILPVVQTRFADESSFPAATAESIPKAGPSFDRLDLSKRASA